MTADPTHSARDFLAQHLHAQLSQHAPDSWVWLASHEQTPHAHSSAKLKTSFSLAPRKIARTHFQLDEAAIAHAHTINPAWRPDLWSLDQAARTLLLLGHAGRVDLDQFHKDVTLLFNTGEVRELVCLYQSLPFFPHAARFHDQAAEGIRTNMKPVFTALAHHNTYPASYLEENFFNQLVLKALFVGVSLIPIDGISHRGNPALTQMLIDYAHERWAAHRLVCPELWYPVSQHLTDPARQDLEKVKATGDPLSQQAATLALTPNTPLSAWQSLANEYWSQT